MPFRVLSVLCSLAILLACNTEDDTFDGSLIAQPDGWYISDKISNFTSLVPGILAQVEEENPGGSSPQLEAVLNSWAEEFNTVRACEADDTYFFPLEDNIVFEDDVLDCDPSEFTQYENRFKGSTGWSIGDDRVLRVQYDSEEESFRVPFLNSTNMAIQERDSVAFFLGPVLIERVLQNEIVFQAR